jgi:hypothetical protein
MAIQPPLAYAGSARAGRLYATDIKAYFSQRSVREDI